jgi:putative membrane protein (TIGR04086 family)
MKGNFGGNASFESFIKPILSGLIVGLIIIALLFVVFAFGMSFFILPTSSAAITASISVAVGAFFGGFVAAKKLTQKGLIAGAICGFAIFLIFTVIGMAAFKTAPSTNTVIRLLIFVLAGSIGGIIGVGNADKRKII